MSITRSSIVRGPAIVQMGGQSFYSQGDIKVSLAHETFPINSSIYGKSGERLSDTTIKIAFTPVGMWTAGLLAVMYPHTNPTIGGSLFGASDTTVVIHPTSGAEKLTFSAGAVTKMPGLMLSAVETSFKEMEITCLIKNNTDRSAADALLTLAATDAFTDTSYSLASIYTVPYSASLASLSAPWAAIETEGGFEIDFDLATAPVTVNSIGMVDMSVAGLDISVKFKPVGMTTAQVLDRLKIQGSGMARGVDISASANNLTITGGSTKPQVVINSVRLKSAPQIYGSEALRHDTLEFIATRPTAAAMFSIGLAA